VDTSFLYRNSNKKELLKHPGFDGIDWSDFLDPENDQDLNEVAKVVEKESDRKVQVNLRLLYNMIYLKHAVEIIVPIIISVWGLVTLFFVIENAK